MAKKLVRDYSFTPGAAGEGVIRLKGSFKETEILLITNVTDNAIIYNFAQDNLGGTCLFSENAGITIVTLDADTSSMSADDSIQVFVDDEYSESDFNEALIDPVNKLRVSEPQNLIDTDFEYGLQPSKWETLELVNNIPAFYPTQSNEAVNDIVSAQSLAESDLITVTTESAHGIPVGTPIDVRGLDSQTAEGKYLISSVPSETTFTYRARAKQSLTRVISGPYTVVAPGQFYSSSDLKYKSDLGLASDASSPSTVTIQTNYVHGVEPGTSVYLTNTIAARLAEVTSNTSSTAPDGRPYVDPVETLQQTTASFSSQNETKEKAGVIYFKFTETEVDITSNKILWANSNLVPGEALLYVPPAGDTGIGGLQRFQIYYVKTVDANGITLCETTNGAYTTNATIDLTSTGTYNYGRAELILAYEVKRMYRGFTETQPVDCGPPPASGCTKEKFYTHPTCVDWARCNGFVP